MLCQKCLHFASLCGSQVLMTPQPDSCIWQHRQSPLLTLNCQFCNVTPLPPNHLATPQTKLLVGSSTFTRSYKWHLHDAVTFDILERASHSKSAVPSGHKRLPRTMKSPSGALRCPRTPSSVQKLHTFAFPVESPPTCQSHAQPRSCLS